MFAVLKRMDRDFANAPLPLLLSDAGRVGESPSPPIAEAKDATLYVLNTLFMRRSSAMVLLSRGPWIDR
jgi:hypothetical protein